jgi:hypothetical protein
MTTTSPTPTGAAEDFDFVKRARWLLSQSWRDDVGLLLKGKEYLADALEEIERLRAPSPAALGEGEVELDALGNDICRDVCELPDRTSPEDQPLMLQVMTEELHGIVTERVRPLLTALTEERERLRAALKPFAAVADIYDDREDAHHQIWLDATEREVKALTVGACQKARIALSHYRSGKEKAE